MKKHVALTLLSVTCITTFFSHVHFKNAENGFLIELSGHSWDVKGQLSNWYNGIQRNCTNVSNIQDSRTIEQALHTIHTMSPPDSYSAKVHSLQHADIWWLAEITFNKLMPAVVVLKQSDMGLTAVPNAVWSGDTSPWAVAPRIRDYIKAQVPQIDQRLLDCYEPDRNLFH